MSHSDFRDPSIREEVIKAKLANPPRRRAAPLAAWFMLTAVMAAHSAVIATALAGRDLTDDVPSMLGGVAALVAGGATLGGLAGLFDQSPVRGGFLGAAMGGLVGVTTLAAVSIPGDKIDLAFHASALAAICIFAAALMGRWQR